MEQKNTPATEVISNTTGEEPAHVVIPEIHFRVQGNNNPESEEGGEDEMTKKLREEQERHRKRAARFGVAYVAPKRDNVLDAVERKRVINPYANNKIGTNLDLFSEEAEIKKKDRRLKFFGSTEEPEEEEKDPKEVVVSRMDSVQPIKRVSLDTPLRNDAIYCYGTDKLASRDFFLVFSDYAPKYIEWINECSCNVVFPDADSCLRAFKFFAKIPADLKGQKKAKLRNTWQMREISRNTKRRGRKKDDDTKKKNNNDNKNDNDNDNKNDNDNDSDNNENDNDKNENNNNNDNENNHENENEQNHSNTNDPKNEEEAKPNGDEEIDILDDTSPTNQTSNIPETITTTKQGQEPELGFSGPEQPFFYMKVSNQTILIRKSSIEDKKPESWSGMEQNKVRYLWKQQQQYQQPYRQQQYQQPHRQQQQQPYRQQQYQQQRQQPNPRPRRGSFHSDRWESGLDISKSKADRTTTRKNLENKRMRDNKKQNPSQTEEQPRARRTRSRRLRSDKSDSDSNSDFDSTEKTWKDRLGESDQSFEEQDTDTVITKGRGARQFRKADIALKKRKEERVVENHQEEE